MKIPAGSVAELHITPPIRLIGVKFALRHRLAIFFFEKFMRTIPAAGSIDARQKLHFIDLKTIGAATLGIFNHITEDYGAEAGVIHIHKYRIGIGLPRRTQSSFAGVHIQTEHPLILRFLHSFVGCKSAGGVVDEFHSGSFDNLGVRFSNFIIHRQRPLGFAVGRQAGQELQRTVVKNGIDAAGFEFAECFFQFAGHDLARHRQFDDTAVVEPVFSRLIAARESTGSHHNCQSQSNREFVFHICGIQKGFSANLILNGASFL